MPDLTWKDPIVEEVRRVRQEHAARFGFDLGAIVADVRSREQTDGRTYQAFPARRPQAQKIEQ